MMNRCSFNICEQPMLLRRHKFKNVTQFAQARGFRLDMHVEQDLVKITVGKSADDHGKMLVGSLVEAFDRVICGRANARATSHGEWVSFDLAFAAIRGKTQTHSATQIRMVLGPCTSNCPVLFVQRVPISRDCLSDDQRQ